VAVGGSAESIADSPGGMIGAVAAGCRMFDRENG
jgi:hypothetical protein